MFFEMIVDVQLVAVIKDTNQAIFSYCYGYLLFKISKIVNVIAYCDCIAINYWSKSDLSDIGTKQKKLNSKRKLADLENCAFDAEWDD